LTRPSLSPAPTIQPSLPPAHAKFRANVASMSPAAALHRSSTLSVMPALSSRARTTRSAIRMSASSPNSGSRCSTAACCSPAPAARSLRPTAPVMREWGSSARSPRRSPHRGTS
jgi:hypothetical protein